MSSSYLQLKSSAPLQKILLRPDLWKGRNGPIVGLEAVSTGYAELDSKLLKAGWPLKGLIELHQQGFGHGDWHLLLPSLKKLLEGAGYVILINPPAIPYAPALAQQNIDLQRLLVINPLNKKDWLVSVREVLAANCCVALFCWEPKQRLLYPELRKIQLAVSQSDTPCFLLRSLTSSKSANTKSDRPFSASPAVLRLLLSSKQQGLEIVIDKQRGGSGGAKVLLPWSDRLIAGRSSLANRFNTDESLPSITNKVLSFNRRV